MGQIAIAANLGATMQHQKKQMAVNRKQQLEQVYLIYLRDAKFWAAWFKLSKEDYEDCVQDAWIKAASHLADYDETIAKLRTWFHRILTHHIFTFKRSRQSQERTTRRLKEIGHVPLAESMAENPAPWWASGEYHVLREDCQKAVQKLLHEAKDLLHTYAPAHEVAFDCLINDVALKEIADKLGRSEESIGASLRRKRQEFVASLNSDTPFGERLRRIKALAYEVAELRRMLDESLESPAAPAPILTDDIPGDDE